MDSITFLSNQDATSVFCVFLKPYWYCFFLHLCLYRYEVEGNLPTQSCPVTSRFEGSEFVLVMWSGVDLGSILETTLGVVRLWRERPVFSMWCTTHLTASLFVLKPWWNCSGWCSTIQTVVPSALWSGYWTEEEDLSSC